MSVTTSKEHIISVCILRWSFHPLLQTSNGPSKQGHPIVEGIKSFAIWAKEGLWKLKILHHAKT